jgi:hypothetical protein
MGFGALLAEGLIREDMFRPITGDVVTMGRQTIYLTRGHILELMQQHGVDTSAIDPQSIELDKSTIDPLPGFEEVELISDKALFRLVTKGTLHALDRSDYEGADVIHDLSLPVPSSLCGVADFIVDGSTLDNTFNPVQTLKNYCDLLRPGGRLLTLNAFSGEGTPYCIMPPMWYLDYFVMNGFVDAKIYIWTYQLEKPGRYNIFTLDLDFLQQHKRGMGRFVGWHPAVTLAFAEKGPNSTTNVFPVQQDYRSEEDWEIYCRNLAVMQQSKRPHLLRSNSDIFLGGLHGGHKFIDQEFKAIDVPDRLIPSKSTEISELPSLPTPAHWDMITGLNAEVAWEVWRAGGQPVLRLIATAVSDRHAIAAHYQGLDPGAVYRASIRFKVIHDANIMIGVRDGTDVGLGRSRNHCTISIDAASGAVIKSEGDQSAHGIKTEADGWRVAWIDIATGDGHLFPYLGLLESGSNIHVFAGRGQELMFGGFEVTLVDRPIAKQANRSLLTSVLSRISRQSLRLG